VPDQSLRLKVSNRLLMDLCIGPKIGNRISGRIGKQSEFEMASEYLINRGRRRKIETVLARLLG
jgi:hypothetical protein